MKVLDHWRFNKFRLVKFCVYACLFGNVCYMQEIKSLRSWTTFEQCFVFWIICHTHMRKTVNKYQAGILPYFLKWQKRLWRVACNVLRLVVLIFDLSFVLCARIGIVLDKSETRLTFSELAWTNSILSVWKLCNDCLILKRYQRKFLRFGLNVVALLKVRKVFPLFIHFYFCSLFFSLGIF